MGGKGKCSGAWEHEALGFYRFLGHLRAAFTVSLTATEIYFGHLRRGCSCCEPNSY